MELKPISEFKSCCSGPNAAVLARETVAPKQFKATEIAVFISALAVWWLIYQSLPHAARYLTYGLLGLPEGSHLAAAVEFFIYDTPKVMMLLTIVVFGVGIINTFFTPERTRRFLAGKKESVGNVLAALLGVATPFCSCSAIPLFIGFVTAGIPLGVTFSFLISAPMVNEVAVVLLLGLVGWEVAAIYTGTGLAIAIVAGWVIGRLKMEKHIEGWVTDIRAGEAQLETDTQTLRDRVREGHRRQGVEVDCAGDCRRCPHPRVCTGTIACLHHGQGRVVVGADRRSHRDPHVFERIGHDPGGSGAPGERCGPGHGACLHDERDRAVATRDTHPAQGAQDPPDRHLRRRGRHGDHHRWLLVQFDHIRNAAALSVRLIIV